MRKLRQLSLGGYNQSEMVCVSLLVIQGADLKAEDKKGRNARQLAFSSNNVRIVTLLDNAVYMYRPLSGKSSKFRCKRTLLCYY